MARKLKSDRTLFTATLLLVCASVVMVYSASAAVALERFDQAGFFLTKQVLWAVLGLGGMYLALHVDYRTYRNEAFVWALVAAVALLLVAVMFSAPINGTRRWFGIGGLGIQPSELAKVACVFFTAWTLERRMHRIDDIKYSMTPIMLIVGLLTGLILIQPDFGTAMYIVLIAGAMVFAAGLNYRYLMGLILLAIPAVYILIAAAPYRVRRLMTFLDPWADPLGDGFQIIQSLISVGTGGVFGRGFMAGVQKLFFLPEPHTDFIFAVIGEELGLLGATGVLVAFCVIAWRGLSITSHAEDAFGALVALGLTMMIAAQALVNMSVVLGLLPTKGIPLPLVSNGGSSLVITLVGLGVLLNISQHQAARGIGAGEAATSGVGG